MALTFSIVTPSFNQAAYLEQTIASVLNQRAVLDYRVMDGGSTDGSVEIIRRYADRLTAWRSHTDDGMYAAIEEGLNASKGEVMGWLNSDDTYFPWTLEVVQSVFEDCPDVHWISSLFPVTQDEKGLPVHCRAVRGFSSAAFLRGEFIGGGAHYSVGFVQQESTFWRRSLWERAGSSLSRSYAVAGDFDLWARFVRLTPLVGVPVPLAAFRSHQGQKSSIQFDRYLAEAMDSLQKNGGAPSPTWRSFLRRASAQVPNKVRRALSPTGLVERAVVCGHDLSGRWCKQEILV